MQLTQNVSDARVNAISKAVESSLKEVETNSKNGYGQTFLYRPMCGWEDISLEVAAKLKEKNLWVRRTIHGECGPGLIVGWGSPPKLGWITGFFFPYL